LVSQELIFKILSLTASKDDLIIDVFAGSGTTGIVAEKLGFNSVLYEIDKSYCEIIEKRIDKNKSLL